MKRGLVGIVVAVLAITGCSSGNGGGGSARSLPRFCAQMNTFGDRVQAATAAPQQVSDLPEARDLAKSIATSATELRKSAPPQIEDAVKALADQTVQLANDLARFYQQLIDKPERANDSSFVSQFNPVTPERKAAIETASNRVRPWVAEHCGSATGSTPTSSVPGNASTSTSAE